MGGASNTNGDLQATVDGFGWYHTLDLPGGVVTPGWVDWRPVANRVLIDADLSGKRVLDIGTWDGFWAFELERRGAEVVTVDVPGPEDWDWPPRMYYGVDDEERRADIERTQLGEGFELAKQALGSSVVQERISAYDLDPDELGEFDLVVVGSILLHLRDPVKALAAIRRMTRGPVVLNEAIEVIPTLLSPKTPRARLEGDKAVRWWQPNLAAVEQMAISAGLKVHSRTRPFFVPLGTRHPRPSTRDQLLALRSPETREHLIAWRVGIAHVSLAAEILR